ncbi:hypothetical protein CC_1648 [Caulobacter vibrioides CB15]|uniref:Uncharacterized protein n=1 Tax=Caulobacter vibrioides (strain ATCC 19089 / CIP 103742 / CB 15) TaxID=190650 RepID=Q9A7S2_CAUVC|nr:hypothetical protein CC_1648 [Caulobacter vibrioides CB15]ATC28531.1 hypothetical protein CA607_09145 [Caulobacter vibrioides]
MPIEIKPLPRPRALDPLFLVRIEEAQNNKRHADHGGNAGDAKAVEIAVAMDEVAEVSRQRHADADRQPDDPGAQIAQPGRRRLHITGQGLDHLGRDRLALLDGETESRLHFHALLALQVQRHADDGADHREERDRDDDFGTHSQILQFGERRHSAAFTGKRRSRPRLEAPLAMKLS